MLSTPMKELEELIIVINDIKADALENFVSFLYCGRFQNTSCMDTAPAKFSLRVG